MVVPVESKPARDKFASKPQENTQNDPDPLASPGVEKPVSPSKSVDLFHGETSGNTVEKGQGSKNAFSLKEGRKETGQPPRPSDLVGAWPITHSSGNGQGASSKHKPPPIGGFRCYHPDCKDKKAGIQGFSTAANLHAHKQSRTLHRNVRP